MPGTACYKFRFRRVIRTFRRQICRRLKLKFVGARSRLLVQFIVPACDTCCHSVQNMFWIQRRFPTSHWNAMQMVTPTIAFFSLSVSAIFPSSPVFPMLVSFINKSGLVVEVSSKSNWAQRFLLAPVLDFLQSVGLATLLFSRPYLTSFRLLS